MVVIPIPIFLHNKSSLPNKDTVASTLYKVANICPIAGETMSGFVADQTARLFHLIFPIPDF